jgi:hypothetical protein
VSIFDDLAIYIVLLCTFVVCLVIFYILSKCWPAKSLWFKMKLSYIRKNFIWNIIIRVLTVTYMKCLMSVGTEFRLFYEDNEFQELSEKITALVIALILIPLPFLAFKTLQRKRDTLCEPGVIQRYGNMYEGVHLFRDRTNIFFYPIFMTRRLAFVLIPSVFSMFPFIQLQLLILGSTFYTMNYASTRPHESFTRTRLEIFNECMMMLAFYHMMIFSEFNLEPLTAFYSGYSMIFVTATFTGTNMGLIGKELYEKYTRLTKIKIKQQNKD